MSINETDLYRFHNDQQRNTENFSVESLLGQMDFLLDLIERRRHGFSSADMDQITIWCRNLLSTLSLKERDGIPHSWTGEELSNVEEIAWAVLSQMLEKRDLAIFFLQVVLLSKAERTMSLLKKVGDGHIREID